MKEKGQTAEQVAGKAVEDCTAIVRMIESEADALFIYNRAEQVLNGAGDEVRADIWRSVARFIAHSKFGVCCKKPKFSNGTLQAVIWADLMRTISARRMECAISTCQEETHNLT